MPPQPPLLFQVAHHRHHGGVGDVPVLLEVTKHIAHRHRLTPGPDPPHHLDFQLTKRWHATSRHQATIQIVDRISDLAPLACAPANYPASTIHIVFIRRRRWWLNGVYRSLSSDGW